MKKFWILLIVPYIIHCANPVSPTGGNKDETPPEIIKVDITERNNQKSISIFFDENIQTTNDYILNPQKIGEKKNPLIVRNRSITVLLQNHHTSLSLNNAIKDLNEGNTKIYPSIPISGNDTHQYSRLVIFPKIIEDLKNNYQIHFQKDSFYYKGYLSKDSAYLYGLPETHYPLCSYIDENKNNIYDSTEWGSNITNPLDTLNVFFPPKKIKISIDTTGVNEVAVIPFYAIDKTFPIKDIQQLSQDTFIGYNKSILEWIKTQSHIIPNYKEIKSKPLITIQKTLTITDTIIQTLYSSNIYKRNIQSNKDSLLFIKDTTRVTKKMGWIRFEKPSDIISIQIDILKNKSLHHRKTLIHPTDSIYLETGEYTFIAYIDKDQSMSFNQNQVETDSLLHYYDPFSIKTDLSNVIKLGKPVNKIPDSGGKTPMEMVPILLPKKGVK